MIAAEAIGFRRRDKIEMRRDEQEAEADQEEDAAEEPQHALRHEAAHALLQFGKREREPDRACKLQHRP